MYTYVHLRIIKSPDTFPLGGGHNFTQWGPIIESIRLHASTSRNFLFPVPVKLFPVKSVNAILSFSLLFLTIHSKIPSPSKISFLVYILQLQHKVSLFPRFVQQNAICMKNDCILKASYMYKALCGNLNKKAAYVIVHVNFIG